MIVREKDKQTYIEYIERKHGMDFGIRGVWTDYRERHSVSIIGILVTVE